MRFPIVYNNQLNENEHQKIDIYSKIEPNKLLGSLFYLDEKLIPEIYENSYQAFLKNRFIPIDENINKIKKFKSLLIENKELFIELIIHSIYKNYNDANDEFTRTLNYIDLCIKNVKTIYFKTIKFNPKELKVDKKAIYKYEPIGNILAITPFNYPLNLSIIKIIPALLTNNHIIYKPSSYTSLIGIKICELLYLSGFNNYQINCIIEKENSDLLLINKTIQLINFTGSYKIGKYIQEKNPYVIHNLEMSGNDIAIIDENIDLNNFMSSIINGCFAYNGQRCTAIKRILVHHHIYEKFIETFNMYLKGWSVGSCLENTNITELIDEKAIIKAKAYYDEAIALNAKSAQEFKTYNNILYPIMLYDVDLNTKIWREEQFLDIVPVAKFNNYEEAINIANNCEYGLQASLYTNNKKIIEFFENNLEIGTLNINSYPARGPDILPFFGIKKSGKGYQGLKNNFLVCLKLKGLIFNW